MILAISILISLNIITGCGPTTFVSAGVEYTNPGWAPPYYSGVRYYYIPDIEAYYDLSAQEFVYMDNGQWLFSYSLPPMYSGFDLYHCFVVSLNRSVYQPWMHNQYYVSHYPRYYYRNTYNSNFAEVRGFNENDRKPIIWTQKERDQANNAMRNKPTQAPVRNVDKPKTKPQPPNYHGKKIGQPVKVKSRMKENKPKKDNPPKKENQPRGKGKKNNS